MESHLRKGFILSPILWIGIVIIVAAGAFVVIANKKQKAERADTNPSQATATPGVAASASPVAATTAQTNPEAQTYAGHGISFTYPKGYVVEEMVTGSEKRLRILNHSSASIKTAQDMPDDEIGMALTYEGFAPSILEQEKYIVENVPGIKKQTLTAADGAAVSYYVFYSQMASDFSTENSAKRLGQIFAYFTLSNGKSFTAEIDNYEWTPKALDQKQVDFIIETLKSVRAS